MPSHINSLHRKKYTLEAIQGLRRKTTLEFMSDIIDFITVCFYVFGFQVQDVIPEDCYDYGDSDIDICTTTIIVDALTDQPVAIER